MARINRRPSANRRSTLIDPEKAASGSMAEKFRSSILGAPGEFRDSSFDPDMASLDELKGRSGEIAKLMAPAPTELTFSDTGKVRDVWSQPPEYMYDLSDAGEPGGPGYWTGGPSSGALEAMETAHNKYLSEHDGDITGFDPTPYLFGGGSPGGAGGGFPGGGGGGFPGGGGGGFRSGPATGKAITTGRIVREHPDKFKDEGDPMETGGRFFKRIPAIKRRTDPSTAFRSMPDKPEYGTPGGYKFIDESDYLGKPDSSLIGF